MADPALTNAAKLVAAVLVSQFAHNESAECHPGIAALAAALATSEDTIKRGLRALEEGGWITRGDGCHRGKKLGITFHMVRNKGCNYHPLKAEKGGNTDPLPKKERGADFRGKGCNSVCPPRPPYKDKPNLNQEKRPQRPHSNLEAIIAAGGFEHEAWDSWLLGRGYPALEHLGDAIRQGGKAAFVVPYKTPPPAEFAEKIAEKWVEWALSERTENER